MHSKMEIKEMIALAQRKNRAIETAKAIDFLEDKKEKYWGVYLWKMEQCVETGALDRQVALCVLEKIIQSVDETDMDDEEMADALRRSMNVLELLENEYSNDSNSQKTESERGASE